MTSSGFTSSRRSLLHRGALTAGSSLFAVAAMEAFTIRTASAEAGLSEKVCADNGGYGELRELTRVDPQSGFEQRLLLPEDFDFRVFSTAGSLMSDGNMIPLGHDGMACFDAGSPGCYRLVRNHEENTAADKVIPSGNEENRYDILGGGGTTTLSVRWTRGEPRLENAWQSLSGTIVNCAGGPTPWGTWLSCEETTAGTGNGWQQEHGYIFEVPASHAHEVDPVPLKDMGRFVHEAVAVDPSTGIVYETEDRWTAGFYRFLPNVPSDLLSGGQLQMLKVVSEWNFDTRVNQQPRAALPVEWVDIDDPDPEDAETDSLAVFNQGYEQGGAVFGRLEGCWWGDGAVYLACTNGGDVGQGQIWEYTPAGHSGGHLKLVYESHDRNVLSFPDNITVTPSGNLILCEDTDRELPAMRGLTREGDVFAFCVSEGVEDEWCGATFSPDGRILFANIQGSGHGDPTDPSREPGRTIAIWGPWHKGIL